MPTYAYACQACAHKFDYFQSMSEPPLCDCPVCGKPQLQRLIGPGAGFIFKGAGFYATDYRSSDYLCKAKADKEGTCSTNKKADKEGTCSTNKCKNDGSCSAKGGTPGAA